MFGARSRRSWRPGGWGRRVAMPALALVFAASLAGTTPAVHAGHAGMLNALDVDYIRAQYEKGRKLTPVDLRSAEEFRQGHLPGARSLPLDQLRARFEEVPKVGLVVLYCDCARSEVEVAYWFLRDRAYRNLSVLEPGFSAWAERGYPVER